jgi:hypothetical protein
MSYISDLPPSERRLMAQAANADRWSRVPLADRPKHTAKARRAVAKIDEDAVDPERRLDPAEREQLAAQARKARMLRLALKSAQARRERAAGKAAGRPAKAV